MPSWKLPISLIIFTFFSCSLSYTFTIINNCPYTIWPGTLSGSGSPPLSTTGFRLDSGQSVKLATVPGWSGRIWARTGCKFDATGIGKCQTGDCGGRLECDGNGAAPPTSLFEITLGGGNGQDFYDISLVDGYNLPLLAIPRGVYGGALQKMHVTGCPRELQVVGGDQYQRVVGCRSACEAFRLDKYCCSGEFANPNTCQPSYYSTIFKRACPRAYSYAFDDGTSTFTCKAYEYDIVFWNLQFYIVTQDAKTKSSISSSTIKTALSEASTSHFLIQYSHTFSSANIDLGSKCYFPGIYQTWPVNIKYCEEFHPSF